MYGWVGVGIGAGPKHYIVKSDSGLGLFELGLDWTGSGTSRIYR